MDAIPAWVVALTGLAAAWAVLSARAMPLPFRIALSAPRLAVFVIYALYTLFDVDIENRAAISRVLLCILFVTEAIAAPIINHTHRQGLHDRY